MVLQGDMGCWKPVDNYYFETLLLKRAIICIIQLSLSTDHIFPQ